MIVAKGRKEIGKEKRERSEEACEESKEIEDVKDANSVQKGLYPYFVLLLLVLGRITNQQQR